VIKKTYNNNNDSGNWPTYLFQLLQLLLTRGMWNYLAGEVLQELSQRTSTVAEDMREAGYLFQQLYVVLQWGNTISFHSIFTIE